jgi:hypothetical protein
MFHAGDVHAAAHGHPERPGVQERGRLAGQAALADAGVAGDQQDPGAPRGRRGRPAEHRVELCLPPQQARGFHHGRHAAILPAAGDRPGLPGG